MSSGLGRGRGGSAHIEELEEVAGGSRQAPSVSSRPSASEIPLLSENTDQASQQSGESSSSGERTIRGRGGFRTSELRTIPQGIQVLRSSQDAVGQPIQVLANFIRIQPMRDKQIFAYRVDFDPVVESVRLRIGLFKRATQTILPNSIFDGVAEARCSRQLPDEETILTVNDLNQGDQDWRITIKRVGQVNYGTFEMLRVYNMHMKEFLRQMQFFQVQSGAYVHPQLRNIVGQNTGLMMFRGYRTAANVHEEDHILMNLESVHKLMQEQNVLMNMNTIRRNIRGGGDVRESVKAALIGKLLVTRYNNIVYRIEDINFSLTPRSTFRNRTDDADISYIQYYQTKYQITIRDESQPLLHVIQNNRRRQMDAQGGSGDTRDIYVVPELCNLAGLTDFQRNDNRLRTDLIRSSQIDPKTRVDHMKDFLTRLHENSYVTDKLSQWGYSYDREPVRVRGRILPLERIGVGRAAQGPVDSWSKVDTMGNFEQLVTRNSLALAPRLSKLAVIITRPDANREQEIITRLKQGFDRVGLSPEEVSIVRIREGDAPHHYIQYLRNLPSDVTCAIVVLSHQHKEKYDAIKKLASVERGLITQVITTKLMMDERKANGASIKIGIQVAAKIGGEPWYLSFPLGGAMVCGYDTYHDTANRGRSYGAFVASTNRRLSRWFSKADSHDHLDELSVHMSQNLALAMRSWREANDNKPLERIIMYRDGVGDGQLDHVFNVELKQVLKAIKDFDERIRLTFIVVNKRIGAKFYMCNNNSYINPPPGSVIDNVVTRRHRYDFYLISQSTRNGTVAPTYYNIIFDQSELNPDKHQMMAYKMCFLYYNWTGTVRVPAPCQYAHKLALLCGEHLHGIPNANLDDKLHFL